MYTRRHALDNRLLVADLASERIVRPAVERRLRGSVESLAIGGQVQAVVETAAGDEHVGAVDATIGAKGVHRNAPGVLLDEHVAFGVPDDGSYLLQAAGDLHDSPGGVDGVLVAHFGDAAAALGERELCDFSMDICELELVTCHGGNRKGNQHTGTQKGRCHSEDVQQTHYVESSGCRNYR